MPLTTRFPVAAWLAIGFVAPLAAQTVPHAGAYKVEAGPYEVAVVESVVLTDSKRKKTIDLRVQYPKGTETETTAGEKAEPPAPERFPLIVFSHGAGGSKEGVVPLTRHWASHGYITVQPTHDDSVQQRRARGETYTLLDAVQTAFGDSEAWVDRARDVRFLLDSLGTIEERVPALNSRSRF